MILTFIFIGFAESGIRDEDPEIFAGTSTLDGVASIFVAQYYSQMPSFIENQPFPINRIDVAEVTYLLQVKNDGEIKLHDVALIDTLPQRMLYNSSWYYDDPKDLLSPDPKIYLDPEVVSNEDGTTNCIKWKLGEFDPGQEKVIVLKVRHSATESQQVRSAYRENVVEASTPVEGSEPLRYISNPAQGLRQSELIKMLQNI